MEALLATEGIGWIAAAAFVAGLVRGFAGFGTAMVFLPVAGQFLPPFAVLTVLFVMDLVAPLPKLPSALRDGHPPDIARLVGAAALTVPLGLWVLGQVDPDLFRWGVSLAALLLLALLVAGVRYGGPMTPPLVLATGGIGGFTGGLMGLPGPPVIFLYMASRLPPAAIRGNIYAYLLFVDVLMLGVIWAMGRLVPAALWTGAVMILPYMAGILIGTALFRPGRETLYRRIAYGVIAVSALSGLPLGD